MHSSTLLRFTLAACLATLATPSAGQAPAQVRPALAPPAVELSEPGIQSSPATTSEYRIGPSDSLRIRVIGHSEFDFSVAVSSRNTIIVPVLGEMTVKGYTALDLQHELTRALADGYIREPQVLVDVIAYNNMKVWVFGYVTKPGEYHLTGATSVMQLLQEIGEFQEGAGDTLTIERRAEQRPGVAESMETQTISLSIEALLRDGDLTQNIYLKNGDKIYLAPSTGKVYAFGEVSSPGFYEYREDMKVADLIQLADGLTEFANQKKIRIRRVGVEKKIKVNLKKYYHGGELNANIPLVDGDIVIVNSSFLF